MQVLNSKQMQPFQFSAYFNTYELDAVKDIDLSNDSYLKFSTNEPHKLCPVFALPHVKYNAGKIRKAIHSVKNDEIEEWLLSNPLTIANSKWWGIVKNALNNRIYTNYSTKEYINILEESYFEIDKSSELNIITAYNYKKSYSSDSFEYYLTYMVGNIANMHGVIHNLTMLLPFRSPIDDTIPFMVVLDTNYAKEWKESYMNRTISFSRDKGNIAFDATKQLHARRNKFDVDYDPSWFQVIWNESAFDKAFRNSERAHEDKNLIRNNKKMYKERIIDPVLNSGITVRTDVPTSLRGLSVTFNEDMRAQIKGGLLNYDEKVRDFLITLNKFK